MPTFHILRTATKYYAVDADSRKQALEKAVDAGEEAVIDESTADEVVCTECSGYYDADGPICADCFEELPTCDDCG